MANVSTRGRRIKTDKKNLEDEKIPGLGLPEKTTEPTAPVSMTAADYNSVLNLVDMLCQRGAVRAEEMTMIGQFYNRMKVLKNSA